MGTKIYEIISEYDGTGEIDECVEKITDTLTSNSDVAQFKVNADTDVFDSPGLDVYYISVAVVDTCGKLHLYGSSFMSC